MSPRTKDQFELIREESKQRILDSSLQLFAKNGYTATSISSIAKEAGISKGLIYNYFKGKEEIAKACTEHIMQIFLQMLEMVENENTPKLKLQALISSYFSFIDEYGPELMTLYIRFSMELSKYDFFKEIFGQNIQKYIDMMIPIFEELGYENPMHAAWELGVIMDGLGLHLSTGLGDEYKMLAKEILAKKYNINIS